MKKKLTALLTAAALCLGICAFAETPDAETAGDTSYTDSAADNAGENILDGFEKSDEEGAETADVTADEEEPEAADAAAGEAEPETADTAAGKAAPEESDTAMAASPSEPVFTGGSAEGLTPPSADTDPMDIANTVDIIIDMQEHPLVVDSFVTLELYTPEDVLLDTQSEWVGGITERVVLHFTTPDYVLGQTFKVRFADGLNSLQYYDTLYYAGSTFYIDTYSYYNESGSHVAGNTFMMTGDPYYTRSVVVYN